MKESRDERQRLCATCKIHWDRSSQLDCPKCGAHAFFTMNEGDIGTAMYFEQSGDDRGNYSKFKAPES